MRVYFGGTLTELARIVADGGLGAPPLSGHAVTPALREWFATGDLEELEYAAMEDAARTSLARLAADPDVEPRRVVVAADVPDALVRPEGASGRSAVVVDTIVRIDQIQAVHVDDPEASESVRAAVEAYPKAIAGDDDASFVVDEAFGHELLWYARQEIPDLLET